MGHIIGDALADFDLNLARLRKELADDEQLCEAVFAGTGDWAKLLTYKLVPHLAGEGCLVAAIAGGTNSGKSTVFNLLLGSDISPIVATAAATRHPVLAASAERASQCLDSKLMPEFKPLPLEDKQAAVSRDAPADLMYVVSTERLPDSLVLLDTPDVDSIEKEHWTVAENIRAAGDVLIAVLTGEKYKDEKVVSFFRAALESGRVVIPVMNKANPADDYEVARQQLESFRSDVGMDGACFVIPHDFTLSEHFDDLIRDVDGTTDLNTYLRSLNVGEIKMRVFNDTVAHFAEHSGKSLEKMEGIAKSFSAAVQQFDERAQRYAAKYDPAPGAEVGGLFHEFIQGKRGKIRRIIGSASSNVAKRLAMVTKKVASAVMKRATVEVEPDPKTDIEIRELHVRQIDAIAHDLATACFEFSHGLREPTAHMVHQALEGLDITECVSNVVQDTLSSESISDEFREHANNMLETWWNDHTGQRRVLEALDTILAIVPTAVAAPISIYTGGIGVPEAILFAGPLVEQFVARVVEYQFGDAMFDFLSPWKTDQQKALQNALAKHVSGPCTESLNRYLETLNGEIMANLRRCHQQCMEASSE